jgi:hypothetical protein
VPEARPRLELLSPEAAPSQQKSGASQGSGRWQRRWGLLALAAALVLSLAALAVQTRRSAVLSERVEGLAAELDTTRRSLEAHRGHLGEIQASVADLQALVNSDPSASAPPAPR